LSWLKILVCHADVSSRQQKKGESDYEDWTPERSFHLE
jgi:hypothetical protein